VTAAKGRSGDDDIMSFADVDEWDRWLTEHGHTRTAVWLALAKKGTAGLQAADAGDVAICHGWIDSNRRALDDTHFLQRFSPRRPGSPWSKVNVERVAALDAAGRMRPAGWAQVEAAKADGRWTAAYEPQRSADVPEDLAAALAGNDRARAAFEALGRSERYAIFLPLLKARTPAARARVLQQAVRTLASQPPQPPQLPQPPQ
jgi:uncharacterized protein YdeI (YjbR/CyaY-like superfamily)